MAARRAGIWVEEFGFGFPPRLFAKRIGETLYSINLLPIGGFVRLHGENSEEGVTKPKESFLGKSKLARTWVLLAGVTMNFLLAVVAFSVYYSVTGVPKETNDVQILEVVAGSPAQEAGLIVGDIIRQVDGKDVASVDEFISAIGEKLGGRSQVVVQRGSETKTVTIKPRENPPPDQGPTGVVISTSTIYFPPIWQRPFVGAYYGFKEALFWGKLTISGFGSLVTDLIGGNAPTDVAGPVGIFALTNEAAKSGLLSLVNFVGILSVNLAIFNLIPFPALDGGRILFIGIEAVAGRRVLPKVEAAINTVGMVLLLLLVVAVTVFDVKRLVQAGSLSGFMQSILNN